MKAGVNEAVLGRAKRRATIDSFNSLSFVRRHTNAHACLLHHPLLPFPTHLRLMARVNVHAGGLCDGCLLQRAFLPALALLADASLQHLTSPPHPYNRQTPQLVRLLALDGHSSWTSINPSMQTLLVSLSSISHWQPEPSSLANWMETDHIH